MMKGMGASKKEGLACKVVKKAFQFGLG